MKRMNGPLFAAIAMVLALASARAADGEWQFKLTPYAWAMGLDGDIGAAGKTVPVDVKFTDALKDLKLAGMVAAEANNGTWGIVADAAYLKLSSDSSTPVGNVGVEVEEWIIQGALTYRIVKSEKTTLDIGAGARSMELNTDISTGLGTATTTQSWVDPLLYARVRQQFGERCFGVVAGDIGGFGVSSDLTWQLTAAAGYSFTKSVSMLIGYRYLDYDYDKDGFVFKVASSGIALGLQFDL